MTEKANTEMNELAESLKLNPEISTIQVILLNTMTRRNKP